MRSARLGPVAHFVLPDTGGRRTEALATHPLGPAAPRRRGAAHFGYDAGDGRTGEMRAR